MIRLWVALMFVAGAWSGISNAEFDTEVETPAVCTGACSRTDAVSAGYKKFYCLAKDTCGKSYIPECGNTCFDHAVDDAIALCKEQTNDAPESCQVITPKAGYSCDTDREALVRKSSGKK